MLCHVALVRTDISEKHSAYIIRMTRISELGTALAVANTRSKETVFLVTLMMEALPSSKTSVLTRATWPNIPEDGNLCINPSLCTMRRKPDIYYV
jgi:hypothetical protein